MLSAVAEGTGIGFELPSNSTHGKPFFQGFPRYRFLGSDTNSTGVGHQYDEYQARYILELEIILMSAKDGTESEVSLAQTTHGTRNVKLI